MGKSLGIYVHIPFCASKCAYCDFYSLADCDNQMPLYQDAIIKHIKESSDQLLGYEIDTVYFGGGTPSFYGAERLAEIFDALKKNGHVRTDAEVTFEANPDSVTPAGLQLLKKAGFNRISLGVQCADDGTLKSIGRRHTFAQAEKAVENARIAGFDNISLDLIYGLPSQSRDDWADTLARCIALKPDHISCYGLKIEEGTPLWMYRDSPFIPDDDAQADMYLYAVDTLMRSGFYQYEISNFAQRGKYSRHNMKYWTRKDYLGFGAAAHSYINGQRFNYIPSISKYTQRIFSGDKVVDQSENISNFEQSMEYIMLGLRTVHGISEAEYREIFPCSFEGAKKLLDSYIYQGWAINSNGRWHLTPKGFLISNTLIGNVLDVQTNQRAVSRYHKDKNEETAVNQLNIFEQKSGDTPLFQGIS